MSDMEYNKGKLIPFDLTEEVAKEFVGSKSEELDTEYYVTYVEQVGDDPSWYKENLVFIDGKYFLVEYEVKRGDLYSIERATENEDGSIDFETYHYNGSGRWTEVVERALNK